MARQRVVQATEQSKGHVSAQVPDGAHVTPEGHRGDPAWEPTTDVEEQTAALAGETGLIYYRCKVCATQQSPGVLIENGGECKTCETVLIRFPSPVVKAPPPQASQMLVQFANDPMFRRLTADQTAEGARQFLAMSSARLPGAEPKADSTSPKHHAPATQKAVVQSPEAIASQVRVVIGEMTFSPNDYHSFKIGPFEATTTHERVGETRAQLEELQRLEFERQYAAYREFMGRVYGAKGHR